LKLFQQTLSICLACQDKEINLLNEQAKEHPFKGKVKSMAVSSGTNKTTTEWAYDATTKQLTGSKIIDSLAKTNIIETYKRDTDGKMQSIGIEKTNADGSKIQSEKFFVYNEKNQVLSIKETIKDETFADEFVYNVDNQLIKYSRNSMKNGRASNVQIVQYTWKQGNATNKTERSLSGGYEEEDYQYGTSENLLAKFYKEELNLFGGYTPEFISQNSPATSIKLFEGSRYKYESEVNQSNKLIAYKILINKGGTWQDYSQIKISYYE
jgi:hypothetical protein